MIENSVLIVLYADCIILEIDDIDVILLKFCPNVVDKVDNDTFTDSCWIIVYEYPTVQIAKLICKISFWRVVENVEMVLPLAIARLVDTLLYICWTNVLIVQSPGVPAIFWAFRILQIYARVIDVDKEHIPGVPLFKMKYEERDDILLFT